MEIIFTNPILGVSIPLHTHDRSEGLASERSILARLILPKDIAAEDPFDELNGLATTAGTTVVGSVIQRREHPDQTTYLGKGKVTELLGLIEMQNADVVLFDNDLNPSQTRNLERALNIKVIDRSELILDIFASKAQTHEARLAVELAQLEYSLPRLKRMWTHLSRQSMGVGMRGPGEKQLEVDRRLAEKRVQDLKAELEKVEKRKAREVASRSDTFSVSLAGYTNAGKSTLMNVLTNANVEAVDRLFATLDTRTRKWMLPGWGPILLSDTVGFIRNLPTTLVKAFRATLEEVVEATILLHVVDASSQHAEHQTAHVLKVLSEIGAGGTRQILVLNKADLLLPGEDTSQLAQRILGECHVAGETKPLAVSARTSEGLEALVSLLDEMLGLDPVSRATFRFPAGNGALLNTLHEQARVIETRYLDELCEVEAEVPESVRKRLEAFLVVN